MVTCLVEETISCLKVHGRAINEVDKTGYAKTNGCDVVLEKVIKVMRGVVLVNVLRGKVGDGVGMKDINGG